MSLKLEYKHYSFPFTKAVQTGHGKWSDREGIWLRVEDESGRVGFGEISPIPWLPVEGLESAEVFLRKLNGRISEDDVLDIPNSLPCTQFGVESAFQMLEPQAAGASILTAALLPSGPDAVKALTHYAQMGYNTFKWKIGVRGPEEETAILKSLLVGLPPSGRLRLDANGAFLLDQALCWLALLEGFPIEFLEQPMSPGNEKTMLELSKDFKTPIALDESVSGIDFFNAAIDQGWSGPLVVKPSNFGSISKLEQAVKGVSNMVIISSAFESSIGYESLLRVTSSLGTANIAMGLGTLANIPESYALHSIGPKMKPFALTAFDLDKLWNRQRL